MYNSSLERLAPKAIFNKRLSFKQRKPMRAILADLIQIKDKILIILLLFPIWGLLVLAMKLLHWTSRARLYNDIGGTCLKMCRFIHHKATGKDPFEAAVKEAEKQRHPKKHK